MNVKMKEEAIKFITEIVKPWTILNIELSKPNSIHPEISDFTIRATSLAVSIKHIPEVCKGIKSKPLIPESRSYEIMSDLADSSKHGELDKSERDCKLRVSSMFERSEERKVRFLRNKINILHNSYGRIDFMTCAMEAAIFVSEKLEIKTDWSPIVFNNSGAFTDEMKLHASPNHQIMWGGFELDIVKLNSSGEYVNVDLDSTVKFTLTSEF